MLGLDLLIDAHLLRVVDPANGTRLPTREEYQEQLKLSREEAKKAKRQAADARRSAAKAERAAAHAERTAADAQRDAEIERRRSAALEAENIRLRGLLPPEQR